jgi:hypothetical protein
LPEPGQLVHLRQRRWLVEGVDQAPQLGEATLVHAACVDDDAQGEPVSVLWEHELDARVIEAMRRERGFAVNPWLTGSRFLVSHRLLVDPTRSANCGGCTTLWTAPSSTPMAGPTSARPANSSWNGGTENGRRRKKPWRYRWPEPLRDEVLARLLALDTQRAEVGRITLGDL